VLTFSRKLTAVGVSIAVVAALAAAWFTGAGANGGGGGACSTPRGYVVKARSSKAVLVRRRHGQRVKGCAFRVGRFFRFPLHTLRFRLSGTYAAYERVESLPDGSEYFIVAVDDLRTGKTRRTAPAYTDPAISTDGQVPAAVSDVALKPNGSVAWISCQAADTNLSRCLPRDPAAPYEVWRSDRRGLKLLDKSSRIGRHSLRRERSTIRWQHGEKTRRSNLR
jgi:hypothetical protein